MINDIKAAIEVLQKGGVILFPTDTTWSLGCDAANEQAVKRILEIKKSKSSKDLVVLMENAALLERFLDEVPEIAYDLIELTDKPLTILFDGAKNLSKNLMTEDGSIAIRITSEAFSSELIRRFKRPVACTPASMSGKPSPVNFDAITREIVNAVDYVVNFSQDDTQKAVEPGVMKLGRGGEVKIIKP